MKTQPSGSAKPSVSGPSLTSGPAKLGGRGNLVSGIKGTLLEGRVSTMRRSTGQNSWHERRKAGRRGVRECINRTSLASQQRIAATNSASIQPRVYGWQETR